MGANGQHRLSTIDQLRKIIGDENPVVRAKLFNSLEPVATEFIKRSPLLLLATADSCGRPEVSPKGDGPGFVEVVDDKTLLIPDRKGNKLLFGLQNILANPKIGLIFLVPGTEETLRVSGTAELTDDPEIVERLSARGQPAVLAIRVRVDRCFFHCAKAFKRSSFWQPQTWPERMKISWGSLLAPKLGGGKDLVDTIDHYVDEDYKTNL